MPIPGRPGPVMDHRRPDTGQVLAGRDMYGAHPPASTIKTLLALTAFDELGLDATVVASPANARVECNCAWNQSRPHLIRCASCSTESCWSPATMRPEHTG